MSGDSVSPLPEAEHAETNGMTRRSWYVSNEAGAAFAAAVDRIYWQIRKPKHRIVSELFQFAVNHSEEIAADLGSAPPLPSS
ncbi:hypothetical protein [Kitasatospora sp. DSM 101779]|uniref:hypothetical protein n=1 Tax=Kitasatospora sp. DSM 101779 TaxID=2853165 RepID=UPI0021DB4158|nr:hypothetical protein [Kitasatospora sp. DSM 101779]MCU7827135.1 hypothetical protein [Kitasatospora sp. DSM 101779]